MKPHKPFLTYTTSGFLLENLYSRHTNLEVQFDRELAATAAFTLLDLDIAKSRGVGYLGIIEETAPEYASLVTSQNRFTDKLNARFKTRVSDNILIIDLLEISEHFRSLRLSKLIVLDAIYHLGRYAEVIAICCRPLQHNPRENFSSLVDFPQNEEHAKASLLKGFKLWGFEELDPEASSGIMIRSTRYQEEEDTGDNFITAQV